MSSQRHVTQYELPSYQFVTDPNYDETLSGRVRAACITCSRRKIKCSGGVPCETCLSHNRRCEGLKKVTRWEKMRKPAKKRTSSSGQTRSNVRVLDAEEGKTMDYDKHNQGMQNLVDANIQYINTSTSFMGLGELSKDQSTSIVNYHEPQLFQFQTMLEHSVSTVERPATCIPGARSLPNSPPVGLRTPALSMTAGCQGLESPHQFEQQLYSMTDAPIDMDNAASCILAAECLEYQACILRLRALGQRHNSIDIGHLSSQQHPPVASGSRYSTVEEAMRNLPVVSFDNFEWSRRAIINVVASEMGETNNGHKTSYQTLLDDSGEMETLYSNQL